MLNVNDRKHVHMSQLWKWWGWRDWWLVDRADGIDDGADMAGESDERDGFNGADRINDGDDGATRADQEVRYYCKKVKSCILWYQS